MHPNAIAPKIKEAIDQAEGRTDARLDRVEAKVDRLLALAEGSAEGDPDKPAKKGRKS